jgi:hypothetical protein
MSAGIIVQTSTAGRFDITGTNLYLTPKTYTITIGLADFQGESITFTSKAYVAAPVLTPIGAVADFTAGVQPSSPVTIGSFIDPNINAQPGDFLVSISWGDGHRSSGTVTKSATTTGLFLVSGSNLYAKADTYLISIGVQDNLGDSTTINSTAVVTNPVLTPIPTTVALATGVQPTSPVAVGYFLDSNTAASASDFATTIDWGDGSSSSPDVTPGIVSAVSPGLFSVSGAHLYSQAGTYHLTIAVQDNLGDKTTIKDSTAVVTSSSLTPIPTKVFLTAGVLPSSPVVVGSFYDADTTSVAGNFTASINWGDGAPSSPGIVSAVSGSPGLFTVSGTHRYTTPNPSYLISISVQDNMGRSALISSMAVVTSSSLTPIGTTVSLTAGVLPSSAVVVGSFYDADTTSVAGNFTASINWGDGAPSSPGIVSAVSGSPGLFSVSGTHLYGRAGNYNLTVTVQDTFGASTMISSTAIVTNLVLTPIPANVAFTAGVLPSSPVVVGSLYDSDTTAVASNFTASIDWGDGNVSPGIVSAVPTSPGLFTVSGTNLYTTPNPAVPIKISVQDNQGHTTLISSTANVSTNQVYGFTGGLANLVINGPLAASGYTNTNRPTFSGTSAPFAIVQLYARPVNTDAQQYLGETVVNANGQWTFTTNPLAIGVYVISATYTLSGGYPSSMMILTNHDNSNLVYIDRSPAPARRVPHHKPPTAHHGMPQPHGSRHSGA